jgi:UDP-N-acetylmuramoylalanine--D-glutamate ligase
VIVAEAYKGKTIAVFGLARSGLSVAASLEAGGANVLAWDDNAANRDHQDLNITDLNNVDFKELDGIAIAPGVPLTHPKPHALVDKANEAGVSVFSDMEIFANCSHDLPKHKLVAITGTNGKSTTTALLSHVLNAADHAAVEGGNIGVPILSLQPLAEGGTYVFEVSSFQIDLMRSFNADIAILLNITPDHLDRHGSMEGYVASKTKLFEMQSSDQVAIIGVDDIYGQEIAKKLDQKTIAISVEREVAGGVYVLGGKLYDNIEGTAIMVGSLAGSKALMGDHNGQNAAAVYAAARLLGLSKEAILEGFESFPGLRHRLQVVGEKDGVLYIDDSKASNTSAAQKALLAYDHIHWIVGGRLKEDDLSLLDTVLSKVKHAYLVGEAADTLAEFIGNKVPFTKTGTIKKAVEEASKKAKSGDVVMLAPACASFDQYLDFEARGRDFASVVSEVKIKSQGGAP